jgi:hypothetical protein
VLRNNGGNDLPIAGNGPFPVRGAARVGCDLQHLGRDQSEQSGAELRGHEPDRHHQRGASVANITVTCMTNRFTVGGSISLLAGSGLQLRLNNEPPLDVPAAQPPSRLHR